MAIKKVHKVQKMLFPLSPIENWLDKALSLLPRKHFPITLTEDENITVIDADAGNYIATKTSAKFKLIFNNKNTISGWFYLEAALVRHNGNRIAKLYVDIGDGVTEANSIFVPSNLRGTIREVIYIPENVISIYWQPSEVIGWFSQSPLIIHRISWIESFYRRIWRVINDLWRLRNQASKKKNGLNFINVFFRLKEAYAWSANLRRNKSNTVSYEDFIQLNSTLSLKDIQAIKEHIPLLPIKPLISFILPVFNPPIEFLSAAISSVIAQHYPYWELCLADDASTIPEIKELLEGYVRKDNRIKVIFRAENGHISAASNSALSIANGDFIALIDQDDTISAHALYHVAVEINRHPNANIIYSDEDKIDTFGNRFAPNFKPDWNPDLFYSMNYISHLGVYKTSLVRDIGGFRLGLEGAQDYDLALRCIAKIQNNSIRHIPRVLYHWRAHSDSTALSQNIKKYANDAGYIALQDHFSKSKATVSKTDAPGMYRVIYPMPVKPPLVSLIIATRDSYQILSKCIESIKAKTSYENIEIIVINNQSVEEVTLTYLSSIAKDKRFKVASYDAPFNYSAINNYAVSLAKGDIIGLINNDIEVINNDWLNEMVRHVIRPGVGVVGAKLLYQDETIQHAGVILGVGGVAGHSHKFYSSESYGYFGRANLQQELSAVTAACLLVKKSIYEQVNGLDENNLTVAFNDIDFCLKVRSLGYRNIYTPYAQLYHHESMSRGQEDSPEKQTRFSKEVEFMKEKWENSLITDPFYNPNLSNLIEDFSLTLHQVKSLHHGYPLSIMQRFN